MKIQIISTGSQGNAILFCDSVLIDVGVSYKYLSEYSQQIKVVLLTHIHGDHFNPSSIRTLYVENEDIKFCCGDFLAQSIIDLGVLEERIIVISQGKKYKLDNVVFSPIFLQHDVPNFGYRIMHNGERHVHATDMANLDGITARDYDSATIEANHDLPEALKIIEDKNRDGEFCHLKRAIRTHLSVDKAIKFINDNNIKKWIPVHIGNATKAHVMDKMEANQPCNN